MAGAIFFLAQPAVSTAHAHRFRLKPLHVLSMSMPPFPSRIKKRKNHLHPKILKTLRKPFSTAPLPQLLPKEVVIPLPLEIDTVLDDKVYEDADKVEGLTVTESVSTPVEYSGIVGKISAKSVLKFCVFVIGVFLIQTTVAVWVLGNDDSEDKERSFNGLNNKGKVFLSEDVKLGSEFGNVVYYDEAKLEEKMSEIRAMAREARERERRERESSSSGIQKEIGAGLGRMGKRLNAKREKMPEKVMEYMGLFEGVEDEFSDDDDGDEDKKAHLNSQEEDRALMFKKKFRFKSPSVNQRSTPKGFSGSKDHSGSTATSESDLSLNSKQNHGAALDKERKNLREERTSGAVQGSREENSYKEVTRLQNSNSSKLQNTGRLAEANQKTTKKLAGYALFGRNGSRKSERGPSINKTRPKQSQLQTEAWWMKLPYVLAILMRRGPENEAAGFYSLRTSSQLDEQDSSYTVVFEDRGDANNFCYLLDSFFEELGDFRADIVPLSTEEVKSESKKVIAVKKGQLKLYAGQPMEAVEMALRSLLEQSQNA